MIGTEKDSIIALLAMQKGRIKLQGQFMHGSNYTFLAQVKLDDNTFQAVYKPSRGEQPLWDFPVRSLAKREVAAYWISEGLGWHFVPPTVYRNRAPLGAGSLQFFIDHDPGYNYFTLSSEDMQSLRSVVLFDLLLNNADRKGSHILFGSSHRMWLIDHGVCFHVEDKLRTVIWDFAGQPIPEELLKAVDGLRQQLESEGELLQHLKSLLRLSEITALRTRAERLLVMPMFPFPREDRRSYPWPLV